jgi:hypothetical protein
MSLVMKVAVAPGTTLRNDQVVPPSVEMKIGARVPPPGGRVNAVATIWVGSCGLTARLGSLS